MKIYAQQQLPRIEQNNSHTLRFSPAYYGFYVGYKLDEKEITGEYKHYIELVHVYDCFLGRIEIISPSFYSDHSGIICKKEMELERKTSVPIKIRLGSLDYVNRLEGKDKSIR